MKYIYSTSQMSKLSLTLRTFSVTSSVAGLFLTKSPVRISKMEMSDLYQKRSGSINEKNGVICELKQM